MLLRPALRSGSMTRVRLAWTVAFVVLVGLAASGYLIVHHGFSARDEPTAVEKVVARSVRRLGVPANARNLKNPIPLTAEVLADARGHFADHCAICHANDGGGDTTIGKNLYPKAPDMRMPDTQQLTDGELYYIIENGIRLTGMPAWGKEADENDQDSWQIVHFIRHLSELTPEQLKAMEAMNPTSPADVAEEKENEDFLRGGAEEPDAPAQPRIGRIIMNRRRPHMKRMLGYVAAALFLSVAVYAHGGMEHLQGTVTQVTAKTITIQTTNKATKAVSSKIVTLTDHTTFERSGQPAALKDLKVGDRVVIDVEEDELETTW